MKAISRLFITILFVVVAGWAIAAGQININTADAETIAATMKGVGEKKAQAIVDYRTEHGPFKSVADLVAVNGIGDKVLEDNVDLITLSSD